MFVVMQLNRPLYNKQPNNIETHGDVIKYSYVFYDKDIQGVNEVGQKIEIKLN